jgi:hypothetical protein
VVGGQLPLWRKLRDQRWSPSWQQRVFRDREEDRVVKNKCLIVGCDEKARWKVDVLDYYPEPVKLCDTHMLNTIESAQAEDHITLRKIR